MCMRVRVRVWTCECKFDQVQYEALSSIQGHALKSERDAYINATRIKSNYDNDKTRL